MTEMSLFTLLFLMLLGTTDDHCIRKKWWNLFCLSKNMKYVLYYFIKKETDYFLHSKNGRQGKSIAVVYTLCTY